MGAKTVDTSSTSANSTTPDANAYNAYLAALQKGQTAATTPYQPYTGSLTAGINATQVGGENTTQNALNTIDAVQDPIAQNIGAGTAGAQTYANLAAQSYGTSQGYAGEVNNLAPGALNSGLNAASSIGGLGAQEGSVASGIGSLAGVYQPYYNAAGAATAAGASMLTPQNFASNVGAYMSPYTQDVVNATQSQFNNANAQQSQGLLSQGIQSGNAFGGDREGVAQGIMANQQQLAQAPVIAGLYNTGYQNATGELNTAASNELQAGAQYGSLGTGAQNAALSTPMAEVSALNSAGSTLATGANVANQGYSTAGSLGSSAAGISNAGIGTANNAMAGYLQGTQVSNQGLALDQADAQLGLGAGAQQFGMGTTQQQTQQAADTAQYGQFQNSIAFPYEQTGWLAGLDATVGPPMGGTSTGSGTATVPAGNIGSTIAGGATALTGLAGLLKRGGRVDSFASGGAPGAGSAPQNFPGGNATWLIPPPPSAHSAFNVPAYQQPNTAGMASSIANSDSQAMSSLGTAAKGLTNSSLGDSISDFTQDLGGAKRGGRIGNFATGGTPGAGGSVATPATPAAPVPPTYGSVTDPATGIVTPNISFGGTTMNIPPPPQLQPLGNDTFGSIPQWSNDFSKAQGAYYAQYPGAPGDPNPSDTPAAAMSTLSSGAPGAAGALTSGSAGSLGSAPAILKPNISAPPIPLTTMQVAAGAKRGGAIGHYDDGGGIYGDLSGVPDSLAANSVAGGANWPDYGTAIAAATGLPPDNLAMAAQYANQMPNPSTMMQNAVDNAPALAVAQQDLSAANPGSFASAPVSANDNGMPFPQQATGTYGPVAGPSDYSSYAGGAGNIGAPGLSTIQGGGTPESLQADAFNQPGVTRYADGTVTGLAPSYIPPTPAGNLASTPASTSYPGAGGASMYTGPVRLASTATQPVGSIGAAPVAGAPAAASTSIAPSGNPFMGSLSTIESGNKNIYSGTDKDYPGQPGSKSQGYFQIDTPTWKQFAQKVGVDTSQYPNAMSAPHDVQAQVASAIPLSRFGPRTQRMLQDEYGSMDTSKTIGQLASAYGGASSGTTLADQPGSLASPAAPSSPQDIAKVAATAPSTGGLLDGLGIHLSKDASLALMSAGFGMMASRSPFFGQGVGEGAQKGVQTYMQAQQLDRQNALTNAQIGHFNAATNLTNTQAKSADLDLAIERNALTKAGILPPGTPVADSAAALGKAIGANAKVAAPPQIAPTGAPSPNSPVTVPVAGGQNEQPAATGQPAPVDPRSPVALRQQAAQYMEQAQGYGASQRLSGLREAAVARANALNAQAAEAETRGGYVNSQGLFTPIAGYNDVQAQKAAVEAKAKNDAEIAAAEPKAEQEATGQAVAKQAQKVNDAAADAQDQKASLATAKQNAAGWAHGWSAGGQEKAREVVQGIGQWLGVDTSSVDQPIANYQDFNKTVAGMQRQAARQEAGSRGAGVRLAEMVQKSMPSPDMSEGGLSGVLSNMDGLADHRIAKQQAQEAWLQSNGSYKGFEADWNKNISPGTFEMHRLYVDNPKAYQDIVKQWQAPGNTAGKQALDQVSRELQWGQQHNLWSD